MTSNNLGLDDDFMATMLSDFLDESQGYLSRLNENLLTLDELAQTLGDDVPLQPDAELLNEMFRDAHSLKGLSAMLQLTDINSLTHKVENVFDAARHGNLAVSRPVIDVMFQAFDRLTGMVERLKDSDLPEVKCHEEVAQIQQLLAGAGIGNAAPRPAVVDEPVQSIQPAPVVETPVDVFGAVVDESDVPAKYLSIFIGETEETLDTLADLLVAGVDADVDAILVLCHRIKGSAASIGLHRTAKLAHAMEDLLQVLREEHKQMTTELSDALLIATDSLRAFVKVLQAGQRSPDSYDEAYPKLRAARRAAFAAIEIQQVQTVAASMQAAAAARIAALTVQPASFTPAERSRIATAAPFEQRVIGGVVTLEAGLQLAELKAQVIFDRLGGLGELFFREPAESQMESTPDLRRLVFAVSTDASEKLIRREIDLEGVQAIELEHVVHELPVIPVLSQQVQAEVVESPAELLPEHDEADARNSNRKADAAAGKDKPAETIRVDIERLDQLMNLAGQLVINKARFAQLGDQLKGLSTRKQSVYSLANVGTLLENILSEADQTKEAADSSFVKIVRRHVEQIRGDLEVVRADLDQLSQARTMVNGVSEAVHQLDRIADGIQKSVMDTRMVPIGPLFGRFKRVIRDITRSNGKDIQLVIRGEKTELDKRMVDELGDPLIHMVRNSADHGVESPAQRIAAGKPAQGTVTLDAFHRGNRVVIQVRDDGQGLDPQKIRAKAVAKGLISAVDAERLTTQQTYQLIWEPGFSTAEKVTEISGRGMGMDIVRSKIEQLNGVVELDSQFGVGTTITIKLPLTMAILPSLLTVISGDVFAVPVESVVEIVRISEKSLQNVHGMCTARVRGRVISVVELSALLQWPDGALRPTSSTNGERTLVIVGTDGNELGLSVDGLLGEEDIVIKSLAENYRNVPGLAGASILGNGRVSLILDVSALVALAGRKISACDAEPIA